MTCFNSGTNDDTQSDFLNTGYFEKLKMIFFKANIVHNKSVRHYLLGTYGFFGLYPRTFNIPILVQYY